MTPHARPPCWAPEPIWAGRRVFVLASGPSLTPAVIDSVRGRPAIAVNSSIEDAPWAEVWFFTDSAIAKRHADLLGTWPGLIITMSRHAASASPGRVKRVRGAWMPDFPPSGSPAIRQGRSSGQTAISLAVAMGAARIVLLGFDMRLVDGREHHHDRERGPRDPDIYEREFLPAFAGWNAAAIRAGVEILNATPGSALTEFPAADLGVIL